jgi:hypothetical protein
VCADGEVLLLKAPLLANPAGDHPDDQWVVTIEIEIGGHAYTRNKKNSKDLKQPLTTLASTSGTCASNITMRLFGRALNVLLCWKQSMGPFSKNYAYSKL